jgi:hypothetical protein
VLWLNGRGKHGIVLTLMPCFAVEAFELRSGEAVSVLSEKSTVPSVVEHSGDGLLRRLYNAHYQAQD